MHTKFLHVNLALSSYNMIVKEYLVRHYSIEYYWDRKLVQNSHAHLCTTPAVMQSLKLQMLHSDEVQYALILTLFTVFV